MSSLNLFVCGDPHLHSRLGKAGRHLGISPSRVKFFRELASAADAAQDQENGDACIIYGWGAKQSPDFTERMLSKTNRDTPCIAYIEVTSRGSNSPEHFCLLQDELASLKACRDVNGNRNDNVDLDLSKLLIFLFTLLQPICPEEGIPQKLWKVITPKYAIKFLWINPNWKSSKSNPSLN